MAALFLWLVLDMKRVERASQECEPLISSLADSKLKLGSYPKPTEFAGGTRDIAKHCHYQLEGKSYVLVLIGGPINMQAYVYSPESGEWHWD